MLFYPGAQYPPEEDLPRLVNYHVGRKFYEGKGNDVLKKASTLLRNTPHHKYHEHLRIGIGLVELLVKKPADMLIQEAPIFSAGERDSETQNALNRIIENNDLVQLIYEMTVSNGYLGDQFIKTYYQYRHDYSELLLLGGELPKNAEREVIIEAVDPRTVFVELQDDSNKRAKAFNIAFVDYVEVGDTEIPYLNVERHIPGAIQYKRFKLHSPNVQMSKHIPITTFTIGEEVDTGRESDIEFTGVEYPLVQHIPYKSNSEDFYGESLTKRVAHYITGIEDVITQILYILFRHTDPILVSPPISDGSGAQSNELRLGGGLLEVTKDDVTPEYVTWDGKLSENFLLLDYLINMTFQAAEIPQWLVGNVIGSSGNAGGGTSHTTEGSNLSRYAPILSRVRAIRTHVDKAVRTTLWTSMELENFAREGTEGFIPYEPVYPTIQWKDGVPKDKKSIAEGLIIANGNKPIVSQLESIKQYFDCDDTKAMDILNRIKEEEQQSSATLDLFNLGLDDDTES